MFVLRNGVIGRDKVIYDSNRSMRKRPFSIRRENFEGFFAVPGFKIDFTYY